MTVHRPDHLPDLAVITPRVFEDERGYFLELFNQSTFLAEGLEIPVVQTNVSQSRQNVLRGLHYQWPNPQGKLVTCLQGQIWDVAVDIRQGSPTFGQHHAVLLDDQDHRLFWIPEGFAHGFYTLSPTALVAYHVTAPYSQPDDAGIHYLDPELEILWPTTDQTIVSTKDKNLPGLHEVATGRVPQMSDLKRLGLF